MKAGSKIESNKLKVKEKMEEEIIKRIKKVLGRENLALLFGTIDSRDISLLSRKLGLSYSGYRTDSVPSGVLADGLVDEFFENEKSTHAITKFFDEKLGARGFIKGRSEGKVQAFIKGKLKSLSPEGISCLVWELLGQHWDSEPYISKCLDELTARINEISDKVKQVREETFEEILAEDKKLRKEVGKLRKERKRMERRRFELKEKLEDTQQKLKKKEMQLEKALQRNALLEKEVGNLKEEREILEAKVSSEREVSERKEMAEKIATLEADLSITRAKLQSLTSLKRVGIFVDAQNMYYAAKELYGGKLDYRLLLEKIGKGKDRFIAGAYIYLVENPEIDQENFRKFLSDIGFQIKSRELIERPDGSRKANWDLGLGIDVLQMVHRFDIIVIVSGDSDFLDLVEYLRKYHDEVGIEVAAFPSRERTSLRLIKSADLFHELTPDMVIKNKNR